MYAALFVIVLASLECYGSKDSIIFPDEFTSKRNSASPRTIDDESRIHHHRSSSPRPNARFGGVGFASSYDVNPSSHSVSGSASFSANSGGNNNGHSSSQSHSFSFSGGNGGFSASQSSSQAHSFSNHSPGSSGQRGQGHSGNHASSQSSSFSASSNGGFTGSSSASQSSASGLSNGHQLPSDSRDKTSFSGSSANSQSFSASSKPSNEPDQNIGYDNPNEFSHVPFSQNSPDLPHDYIRRIQNSFVKNNTKLKKERPDPVAINIFDIYRKISQSNTDFSAWR